MDNKRGSRSTLYDVKRPTDKPCRLKRHFILCMRQVVGFAEKLADNDHERFVFVSEKGLLPHCKKRGGGYYHIRQVRYCLVEAERLGIMIPAQRVRKGVLRSGFIVPRHDDLTTVSGSRCILNASSHDFIPRALGERRNMAGKLMSATRHRVSASGQGQSASSIALKIDQVAPESASSCRPECLSECPPIQEDYVSEMPDSKSLVASAAREDSENEVQIGEAEPSHPSQVNPNIPVSYNPVSNNPVADRHRTATEDKTQRQLNDSDLQIKHSLCVEQNPLGIEEHFECFRGSIDDLITAISDGEFDISFLKYYKHKPQLMDCCNAAIDELAGESYLGRQTCARIMSRAMELLSNEHQLDVPGGWVPILRRLRNSYNRSGSRSAVPTMGTNEVSDEAVTDLCITLHNMSDLYFTGKNREGLRALMQKFSPKEIEAAFRKYLSTLDDFQTRFAPKNFVEGAGEDTILAARQYEREMEVLYAEMDEQTRIARKNLEQELAKPKPDEQVDDIPVLPLIDIDDIPVLPLIDIDD